MRSQERHPSSGVEGDGPEGAGRTPDAKAASGSPVSAPQDQPEEETVERNEDPTGVAAGGETSGPPTRGDRPPIKRGVALTCGMRGIPARRPTN